MSNLLLFPEPTGLADADARADALDIHQSWIVEAPAGSGKTGLIIQRYLKLLADSSVAEPEQVLAITFTTKATAEMRDRVLAQLQSAASGGETSNEFDRATRELAHTVLARDRELGWSLLDQPGRLKIRTIDAVCSEIANSLPILSGSGGRRTPVDDPEPLYALAARRTFLELGGADRILHQALSTILLHRDGNLAECEKLLGDILALRDQWGELVPLGRAPLDDAWLDANVLPRLERTLDHAICAALTQLADAIPAGFLTQLTLAADESARYEQSIGKVSPVALCAGRLTPPGAVADDLEHWRALIHLVATKARTWRKSVGRKTSHGATIHGIVENLRENDELLLLFKKLDKLPPAKYPADQWAVAKCLFRVLNRAMVELQLVFAESGQCDFAEVALAARAALNSGDGPHDLEAALGVRLQHLLVDEMQDTSASQYELIQTLTRSWDGHGQTILLVGDPKQSIYLFRQARVERFLRTMRSAQLGDLPLGVLRLTANFRSQSALVNEFNADFAQIFPAVSDSLHPEEVPYVRAVSARTEPTRKQPVAAFPAPPRDGWDGLDIAASGVNAPRVWHTTIHPYETDLDQKVRDRRVQRRADAVEVCRIVDDWRARPLPQDRASPWKIAVLCRSRSHLDEIVAAFKSAAIPFRAVEIDALKDRPEVRDLIALTRALLHPADRVAWLAILRAPWCGLSLAELHTLAGADDAAWAERAMHRVIAERGHLLPDDACQRLQRIWPTLEAAVESRARLSLSQLVERTWRSLGGAAYLDTPQLANANRYLRLLDRIEADLEATAGIFDLALLERRIDKLYAAPALLPVAVDLLTIHKAKGLEWDVVIVPALERTPPPPRRRLLNWVQIDSSDEQSANVLLAPIAGKGEDSRELTKWISAIDRGREAAERKRLFYVACTRAREELHLFAAPARTAGGAAKPIHNSLLAAAWPAAGAHFSNGASEDQPVDLAAAAQPNDETEAGLSMDGFVADEAETVALPWSAQAITATLQRLPLSFNPATQFLNEHPLSYGKNLLPPLPRFDRPEGSLAARAFGNAVHALLEQVAYRLAAHDLPSQIKAALRGWMPRIAAILRSEGLQPAVVQRLTERVVSALEITLDDATGIWLLSPHAEAATEFALTTWSTQRSNLRLDRIFRAGADPHTTGSTHLWIVDFKTTQRVGDNEAAGVDAFLLAEKMKYAPQLEAYADALLQTEARAKTAGIRVALYYPLLARLVWWPVSDESAEARTKCGILRFAQNDGV